MTSVFVQFRGEEREVIVERDHGYEPDTGAHEIDWHFADSPLRDADLTDEEETEIHSMLAAMGEEMEYE